MFSSIVEIPSPEYRVKTPKECLFGTLLFDDSYSSALSSSSKRNDDNISRWNPNDDANTEMEASKKYHASQPSSDFVEHEPIHDKRLRSASDIDRRAYDAKSASQEQSRKNTNDSKHMRIDPGRSYSYSDSRSRSRSRSSDSRSYDSRGHNSRHRSSSRSRREYRDVEEYKDEFGRIRVRERVRHSSDKYDLMNNSDYMSERSRSRDHHHRRSRHSKGHKERRRGGSRRDRSREREKEEEGASRGYSKDKRRCTRRR